MIMNFRNWTLRNLVWRGKPICYKARVTRNYTVETNEEEDNLTAENGVVEQWHSLTDNWDVKPPNEENVEEYESRSWSAAFQKGPSAPSAKTQKEEKQQGREGELSEEGRGGEEAGDEREDQVSEEDEDTGDYAGTNWLGPTRALSFIWCFLHGHFEIRRSWG